jgi:RNA polymerase sigma-70 factor (ECF subfamily)
MTEEPLETADLLQRWHGGDKHALEALLRRDLPWIEGFVRKRLGPLLRGKAETVDYVQDAVVEVLRYGPRFVCSDRERFRALLARIVENTLRDKHDWHRARRRAAEREAELPRESALDLDGSGDTPSRICAEREREQWIRLALELLDPDERQVILLREWEQLSFEQIGERLGCSEEAARKRFTRALPQLVERVRELQSGRIGAE